MLKQDSEPTQRKSKGLVTEEPEEWDDPVKEDSDDTIIHDLPMDAPLPLVKKSDKTKKKKPAAKFVICTIGLKAHKDAAMMQETRKTRKRVFKCYLCDKKFPDTKGLNKHFKQTHYGLDCETCRRVSPTIT